MKFGVIFGDNFLISIWKHDGGRGIDFHWNNLSAQGPYFLLFPALGIFFFGQALNIRVVSNLVLWVKEKL